jgi:hypothetical protein
LAVLGWQIGTSKCGSGNVFGLFGDGPRSYFSVPHPALGKAMNITHYLSPVDDSTGAGIFFSPYSA